MIKRRGVWVDRTSRYGPNESSSYICRRGATVSSSRRWTTERSNNVGLLNGCATGTKKGNPRRLYEYYMHPHTYPLCVKGGVCPIRRAQLVNLRLAPLFLYAHRLVFHLSLFCPPVLRPLVDPGDKGASATLCVGSGRLVSRIGRLFETASRVDIALVTNEKVGSSNVDASTWLRLRSGSPWRKEELFVLNHGYLGSANDTRHPWINVSLEYEINYNSVCDLWYFSSILFIYCIIIIINIVLLLLLLFSCKYFYDSTSTLNIILLIFSC